MPAPRGSRRAAPERLFHPDQLVFGQQPADGVFPVDLELPAHGGHHGRMVAAQDADPPAAVAEAAERRRCVPADRIAESGQRFDFPVDPHRHRREALLLQPVIRIQRVERLTGVPQEKPP